MNFRHLRGAPFAGVALSTVFVCSFSSGAGTISGLWSPVLAGSLVIVLSKQLMLHSNLTGPTAAVIAAVVAILIAPYLDNGIIMATVAVVMTDVFNLIVNAARLSQNVIGRLGCICAPTMSVITDRLFCTVCPKHYSLQAITDKELTDREPISRGLTAPSSVREGIGNFVSSLISGITGEILGTVSVHTITDADDAIVLNAGGKRWLNKGNAQALLYQLRELMFFGAAQAITPESIALKGRHAVVFD